MSRVPHTPAWILDARRQKELRLIERQQKHEGIPRWAHLLGSIAMLAAVAVIGLCAAGVIGESSGAPHSAREGQHYNASSQWTEYWLDVEKGGE